jgi:hypothetical protein
MNLGMMKNFVRAVDHDGKVFRYLQQKFPQISESKVKEGIFGGPQVKDIMKDEKFDALLKSAEKPV